MYYGEITGGRLESETERLNAALAGRYAAERELGRGGMAMVYLAADLRHERMVALKVLRPELAQSLGSGRFLREIRVTAQLDHPHIIPLLDSGEADGLLYYVMPLVEGESLRDRLNREKQLSVDDAVAIAREVADALDHAHRRGIVHRDIKPENIMLSAGHARVADFGIARAVASGGDALTEIGMSVGTPLYMSPEQAAAERDVDGRADIYSLGCVAYEMLTGHPPFTGSSAREILARHAIDPVPSITAARAVPEHVRNAIQTALAKSPADRFSAAAELSAALGGEATSSSMRVARARFANSRRVAAGGLIAAVLIAVAVIGIRFGRSGSAQPEPSLPANAIAVLPFQSLSAEQAQAYFAGGLHDELLTQLSKVSALKVISRASVMGYAGTHTPLRQIGQELGAGTVVEGSVQVAGTRLRVNVRLIDVATGGNLWAETYDRTLEDAFAIQSDVAQQVVSAIGATLTGSEVNALTRAPTSNPEAYRLYLQGRYYRSLPGFQRSNYERAQELYERAIQLDPNFALAHAALATIHGAFFDFRLDPTPERLALAQREADKAIELAPDLPDARVVRAMLLSVRGDDEAAASELSRALRGMPSSAEAWFLRGQLQLLLGDWDGALAATDKAVDLNPRDARTAYAAGTLWTWMRNYPRAIAAYDRALKIAPDFHIAAVVRGWTLTYWEGHLDTMRAVMNRLPAGANLEVYGTRTVHDAQLLFWERQPGRMLQLLSGSPRIMEGQPFFWPRPLYAALAHRMLGNATAAQAAYDSALAIADSALRVLPDDWRVHAARGLTVAGLGRCRDALREVDWLGGNGPKDAFWGPMAAEARARILAQCGEGDAAATELEKILASPAWFSVHTVRLDPLYDPIRDDPRIRTIVTRR